MKLWITLYGAVWIAFFSCVLLPRWMGIKVGFPIHILLGLVMFAVALYNSRRLAAIRVPPRLKRIGKLIVKFAAFQIVFGAGWGTLMHFFPDTPYLAPILQWVHIVCALAILAQTSSLATAYEMWEEKEFEKA